MDQATQEGTAVGIEGNKKNIIDAALLKNHPILSGEKDEAPGMTVCQSDAQEMMDKRGEARQKGDRLQGDVLVGALLASGDQCVNNPTAPLTMTINTSSTREEVFDCTESAKTIDNQVLYYFRNLKLDIFHQPEIRKNRCCRRIKRCLHPYPNKHKDDDLACGWYDFVNGETRDIDINQDCGRGLGWTYYIFDRIVVQHEVTDLKGESWVLDDPSGLFERVRNNTCNLVKTECVAGPETRSYHGKGFHRKCWSERMTVVCPFDAPETNGCSALRKKGCQQMDERCIKTATDGRCIKWTKRYRCPARSTETVSSGHGNIYNIDGGSLTGKSTHFNDMAASLTQLQVLSEMQKEVKNITSTHQTIHVFKGQCNRCKKNIMENILYDCCAVQGLAMDLNLVDCNPEERQLSVMRGEGKCHYVGATHNQFMGMWTSSDTHVYCCFPSPLIAHLQKEARKQLGKDFGLPTNPDCGGLSMAEIQRVDFSKMDLSPLFEDLLKKARTNKSIPDTSKAAERMAQKVKDLKLDIPPPGYESASV